MNEFLRGVLIGLTVAIPVGPMAVLTIRKSLLRGHPVLHSAPVSPWPMSPTHRSLRGLCYHRGGVV
ncbi:MAG: hypothetical protein R2839_01890 [Thermomicrobiales bacterium]